MKLQTAKIIPTILMKTQRGSRSNLWTHHWLGMNFLSHWLEIANTVSLFPSDFLQQSFHGITLFGFGRLVELCEYLKSIRAASPGFPGAFQRRASANDRRAGRKPRATQSDPEKNSLFGT